jgi:hypothetical protein
MRAALCITSNPAIDFRSGDIHLISAARLDLGFAPERRHRLVLLGPPKPLAERFALIEQRIDQQARSLAWRADEDWRADRHSLAIDGERGLHGDERSG